MAFTKTETLIAQTQPLHVGQYIYEAYFRNHFHEALGGKTTDYTSKISAKSLTFSLQYASLK